jgi:hypothetical protein
MPLSSLLYRCGFSGALTSSGPFSYAGFTLPDAAHSPFPHLGKRRFVYNAAITRRKLTGVNNLKYLLVFGQLPLPEK